MKIVLGPETVVFNDVTTPFVEHTMAIIQEYNTGMEDLKLWLQEKLKEVQAEYERRQRSIMSRTESRLKESKS